MLARLTTAVSIVCLASSAALASMPEVFQKGGYEKASALASERETYLIVDFTAVWCGPCKQMDRDTWVDDSVKAWIREHAVAVQVDVDRQKDIAQSFKVSAMPTVVILKDGEEVDRKVGYQNPQQMLAWYGAVLEGKSTGQVLRELMEEEGITGVELVDRKYELARHEMQSENYEEATELYAWLWENMLAYNPNMVGVKGSYTVSEIGRLIDAHPPARARFDALRAEDFKRLNALKDYEHMSDWVVLSKALGEGDEVIAWYDEHADDAGLRQLFTNSAFVFEDIFVEHGRWAALGRMQFRPVEMYAIEAKMLKRDFGPGANPEAMAQMKSFMLDRAMTKGKHTHTALLAAGREIEAFRVAGTLFENLDNDHDARNVLATHALEAGYPHRKHLEWCETTGDEPLAAKIRAALDEH